MFDRLHLVRRGAAASIACMGVAMLPAVASAAAPGSTASLTFSASPLVAGIANNSDYGISGTVYDPCSGNIWFTSSNARTKNGKGSISAAFSSINPGGLKWILVGQSNQQIGSEQEWTQNETNIWRTFASNVNGGTVFYNSFAEYTGKCGYGNYSFSGTESY